MATPGPNLFHRLHKWAHRQDENFLTESLAVVLEQLLVLAPAVGTRLIRDLTGGFIDLPPEDASAIEIQTQVEAAAGRPDLEIRTSTRLAWIEVKTESELRTGQLEGYRVMLNASVSRTPSCCCSRDIRPNSIQATNNRICNSGGSRLLTCSRTNSLWPNQSAKSPSTW